MPHSRNKSNTKTNNIKDLKNQPKHIAIIMDGNRRWAKKHKFETLLGHQQGTETVRRILKECKRLHINHLSLYTFSSENWNRSKSEVTYLMNLFHKMLKQETPKLHKEDVKVKIIGNLNPLSTTLKTEIETTESLTANNTTIQLNLMFNYGSQQELIHGIKSLSTSLSSSEIKSLTETDINNYLYTKDIPNPDMLIRPGGEYRLSNFLLWQCAYSELFFSKTLWPDFSEEELFCILKTDFL